MENESDKRYEATLYTQKGVHVMAFFDGLNEAHNWLMKQWEKCSEDRAAVIFDQSQNRRKVFVMDPHFVLSGKNV